MMRKSILLCLVLSIVATAEFIKNPDANTLWIENGKNIELDATDRGYKGWLSTEMDISCTEATEDDPGYFTFKSPESKKHSVRRYVPIDKDHPWLEFEVASYVPDAKTYQNFWLGFYKGTLFFTHTPKPGIYLQNIYKGSSANEPYPLFDMTIYGYEVNFRYIKLVKEPENYFMIDSPAFAEKKSFTVGDKLIFTAKLAAGAEDVTITFFDTYFQNPIRINGEDFITLKPTNEETTEWRAECDVKSITGFRKGKKDSDGMINNTFVFKCTVLGGKLRKPMYTNNFYPYKSE